MSRMYGMLKQFRHLVFTMPNKPIITPTCPHCKNELTPIRSLLELEFLPSEWYIEKDLTKNWAIYICRKDRYITRCKK